MNMSENELSKVIVDTAFKIHVGLGPGLLESVYEEVLNYEFEKAGLYVERQKIVPVIWDKLVMKHGFKADLIINEKVMIEIKSVKEIEKVHFKQLLTYLKLTGIKLGFSLISMKPISRME